MDYPANKFHLSNSISSSGATPAVDLEALFSYNRRNPVGIWTYRPLPMHPEIASLARYVSLDEST